ncbi:hypothetical protein CYMTET_50688 [Cymbomonas tetramitiformis]|uniref:Uncharacterized protein n=1 Tax=Cymbomonas tetramitiformis TaxID=36881 RepID=A0AAE0BNX3_9CHLO|nr:hypothetical protein CYMTET_50688 [Cymbomonas tetramitiformis]
MVYNSGVASVLRWSALAAGLFYGMGKASLVKAERKGLRTLKFVRLVLAFATLGVVMRKSHAWHQFTRLFVRRFML